MSPVFANMPLAGHPSAARWVPLEPCNVTMVGPGLASWTVQDQQLDRTLHMLFPDHRGTPGNKLHWDVSSRRRAFEGMAAALAQGPLAFPEPIDLIRFDSPFLPQAVAQGEPGLIIARPRLDPLRPFPTRRNMPDGLRRAREGKLRALCMDLAYALRELHGARMVARAVPPASLGHTTTGALHLGWVRGLRSMEHFDGYNPHDPAFHPDPRGAAPECFQSGPGSFGPATDVYAIGATLVAFLGGQLPSRHLSHPEVQRLVASLEVSEPWARRLVTCLHPDPAHRFTNCGELIVNVLDVKKTARKPRSSSSPSRAPDRPRAALVIAPPPPWAKGAIDLDLTRLVTDLQTRFDLWPRLAIVREQTNMNNGFYLFLQRALKCKLLAWRDRGQLPALLEAAVPPMLLDNRKLIMVGHAGEEPLYSLSYVPAAKTCLALHVTAGGPKAKKVEVIDGSKFAKKRQGSRR